MRISGAIAAFSALVIVEATSANAGGIVSDEVIAGQRATLAEVTKDGGFGPQSPRDIGLGAGANKNAFGEAPPYTRMNLCNIHFHKNAEHKGGEFDAFAGNGDGHGYNTGYVYSGELTPAERTPLPEPLADKGHGGLQSGDTIEVHYVHSTARVSPDESLKACLDDAVGNPQLRVETQVFVLVNDSAAGDFVELTKHGLRDGYHQALNILNDTGIAVQYEGSTTGPSYNEKASLLQVSWSVRPEVAKVNIHTVAKWFEINVFEEDHAHAVRNLVINPDLLSQID